MSVSIVVSCNTVWGSSSCAARLITDGLTIEEARKIGSAQGWRHTTGRDYCAGCSGSKIRPRLIVAVDGREAEQEERADGRLQAAECLLLALLNGATSGTWSHRRTDATGDSPGIELVAGGPGGTSNVARTGPAGNSWAAADAAYIATVDPEVGRAVVGILREAFEIVNDELGRVESPLTRAAVDLADAILRPRYGIREDL